MTLLDKHTVLPKSVIGYTTRSHLLLDLDDTSFIKARRLATLLQEEYPELGDVLIVESSPGYPGRNYWKVTNVGVVPYPALPSYHLIFDNDIGYARCCEIITTLANLDVIDKEFIEIREFRGDMTLRVSERPERVRTIPKPKAVYFKRGGKSSYGIQGISRYLLLASAF